MTVTSIANAYVNLCKGGKFDACLTELYSTDAVSVEAWAPPGVQLVANGLEAIRAKGKAWADAHEIHKIEVSGPYPNEQRFAVRFSFDVTSTPTKQRMTMDEIGLFTVENGKIVREEFFYNAG